MFFNISTHTNVDYVVTKESYVTIMGQRGNCLILFVIDFVVKYLSEMFYISRTFVVQIFFFSLSTFHFGKQNSKVTRNK